MKAIEKAISILGRAGVSSACGVTPEAVTNWKRRGVPSSACINIQSATEGKVTVHDLRPDIFGPADKEAAA